MSPQQDMSKKIGTSSSPIVNRVLQNNKNVQQPEASVKSALADKHTNKPVQK
jgi:hypothetical protein